MEYEDENWDDVIWNDFLFNDPFISFNTKC